MAQDEGMMRDPGFRNLLAALAILASPLSHAAASVLLVTPQAMSVAGGETKLVLGIDSDKGSDFGAVDQDYLERIIALVRRRHFLS